MARLSRVFTTLPPGAAAASGPPISPIQAIVRRADIGIDQYRHSGQLPLDLETVPWETDMLRTGPAGLEGMPGKVHPGLRTGQDNRDEYTRRAQKWMSALTREEVKDPTIIETLRIVGGHLRHVVIETNDMLLEGGNLPHLVMEALSNDLWAERHAVDIFRLHINLTTANGVDKHQGLVGTALRLKTLEWLRNEFGRQNVFFDPIRTSYLVKVTTFKSAGSALGKYSEEVGYLVREDPQLQAGLRRLEEEMKKGDPQSDVDLLGALRDFEPNAIAFGMTFSASDLNLAENLKAGRDPVAEGRKMEAAVIQRIRSSLRELAASTTYVEKHMHPHSEVLHTKRDLPNSDDNPDGHRILQRLISQGTGYTGVGVYDGEDADRIRAFGRTRVENPRFGYIVGHLDRDPDLNGGGVIQRFAMALGAMIFGESDEVRTKAFGDFKTLVSSESADAPLLAGLGLALDGNLLDILKVSAVARRDPAYPRLYKRTLIRNRKRGGGTENTNAFISKMAARGYRFFATSENDGAKARGEAYPSTSHVDGEFQLVRKIWFDVAQDMGMVDESGKPRVIISAFQGDQIAVAFDPGDHSAAEYLGRVQTKVREAFEHQPFQAEVKMTLPSGEVTRRKVWKRIMDDPTKPLYRASGTKPDGYEPVMVTQTITTTYVELAQAIKTPEEGAGVMDLFGLMGTHIDHVLKCQRDTATIDGKSYPIGKQGFGVFPGDEMPQALRP